MLAAWMQRSEWQGVPLAAPRAPISGGLSRPSQFAGQPLKSRPLSAGTRGLKMLNLTAQDAWSEYACCERSPAKAHAPAVSHSGGRQAALDYRARAADPRMQA